MVIYILLLFFFVILGVHEGHSSISLLENNYFILKRCRRVMLIRQRVCVVRGVSVARVDPSDD